MAGSNEQYELIARCLARHHNALLRIARPYASGAIQAEDIVQQAALISLANSDKLRTNEAAVAQWLFRVVKDVGRRVSTKRARRQNLRAEHVHPAAELADPFPLSSEREECVARVLEAADSLSTDQRRVVHCILHGLSHKETADELDRTVGAVRVLWHRAVRNLRKLLRPSANGP